MNSSRTPRRVSAIKVAGGEGGFSLIDAMLATVILAVGLLALAGMQGISLGRNVDANELTVATNLAAEMVERIQFNRRHVQAYNGINTVTQTKPGSTETMALGDYDQWRARLRAMLPDRSAGGTVTVERLPTTTPSLNEYLNQHRVTVTVNWLGPNSENSRNRQRTVRLSAIIAPE